MQEKIGHIKVFLSISAKYTEKTAFFHRRNGFSLHKTADQKIFIKKINDF